MLYKKRCQISVFAVLGIVMLITFGLFFYAYTTRYGLISEQQRKEVLRQNLPELPDYIEGCIEKEAYPLAQQLAKNGGTSAPAKDSIYYGGEQINFLCIKESPTAACVNTLLTRQQMEFQLSEAVKNSIKKCVNLNIFRNQGAEIQEGEISAKTTIGKTTITIELTYPLTIKSRDKTTRLNKFSRIISLPLGELYELTDKILNSEIYSKSFDIDRFMEENGYAVMIEKHRPYPHIIYLLSKKIKETGLSLAANKDDKNQKAEESSKNNELVFRFALQGSPAVGQYIGESMMYGSCYNRYDKSCFSNVPEAVCSRFEMAYSPNPRCEDKKIGFEEDTDTKEPKAGLKGCKTKSGEKRQNGESWCEYDTITGKGFDYAGSRHYKYYCIGEEIKTEECRDYREELCTETQPILAEKTKAVCRKNRWHDCSSCTYKSCCENSEYRDCFWDESLATESRCVPEVPPGLRFWEMSGIEVCMQANSKKECKDISCPQQWLDSAAALCYKQGDCGNYRNIDDKITKMGFFETDILGNPDDKIYLNDNLNENSRKWILNLPLEKTSQQELLKKRKETPAPNVYNFIVTFANMLQEVFTLDFSDLLKPFKGEPLIQLTAFTQCSLWQPPILESDCSRCADKEYPERPCTEYRCKSLGESCLFEYGNGNPKCTLSVPQGGKAPMIAVDESIMDKKYALNDHMLTPKIKGIELAPKVPPHKPLILAVNTTTATKCKMDYAPSLRFTKNKRDYYSLPSLWFGDPVLSTHHEMRFRVPPEIAVPNKILDFLNFTSTEEFARSLDTLDEIYADYKKDYEGKTKIYDYFSGSNIVKTAGPMIKNFMNSLKILVPEVKKITEEITREYTGGGYYIFIKCIDSSGKENEDQFYFKFEVDENYADNDHPEIIKAVPEDSSEAAGNIDLRLYLDEPAECRYDLNDKSFDAMKAENEFGCATGAYELSAVEGGTYECSKKIVLADLAADSAGPDKDVNDIWDDADELKLNIRCKDNPVKVKSYLFSINKTYESYSLKMHSPEKYSSASEDNEKYDINDYAGVRELNIIDAPSDLINDLVFSAGKDVSSVNLNLYVEDSYECRYAPASYTPSSSYPPPSSYPPSAEEKGFDDMDGKFESCVFSKAPEKGMYKCTAKIDLNVMPGNKKDEENKKNTDPKDEGADSNNDGTNKDNNDKITIKQEDEYVLTISRTDFVSADWLEERRSRAGF